MFNVGKEIDLRDDKIWVRWKQSAYQLYSNVTLYTPRIKSFHFKTMHSCCQISEFSWELCTCVKSDSDVLWNRPRLAYFPAEYAPSSYQRIHFQIDCTPNIVSDFDYLVRDRSERCIRIDHIESHGIVTGINTFHPAGPIFMDYKAKRDGKFRVSALLFVIVVFWRSHERKDLYIQWGTLREVCRPICSQYSVFSIGIMSQLRAN